MIARRTAIQRVSPRQPGRGLTGTERRNARPVSSAVASSPVPWQSARKEPSLKESGFKESGPALAASPSCRLSWRVAARVATRRAPAPLLAPHTAGCRQLRDRLRSGYSHNWQLGCCRPAPATRTASHWLPATRPTAPPTQSRLRAGQAHSSGEKLRAAELASNRSRRPPTTTYRGRLVRVAVA